MGAFRDLAVSDGRLNVERAIYSRLFQPAVLYTFYDFDSFEPDVLHDVTARAKTVDPWIDMPQIDVTYRATLLVPLEERPAAVVGHEIRAIVGGVEHVGVTDETGRALLGETFNREERSSLVQEGNDTPLRMKLPAGSYALVVEIVDVRNPAAPVTFGEPSAVFFNVRIDGSVTEMPGGELSDVGEDLPPAATTTTAAPAEPDPGGGPDVPAAPTSTAAPDPTDDSAPGEEPQPEAGDDAPAGEGSFPAAPPEETSPDAEVAEPVVSTTAAPPTEDAVSEPDAPATGGGEAEEPAADDPADPGEPTTAAAPGEELDEAGEATDPFEIGAINPDSGPTSGGTQVTITGDALPARPEVLFGDVPASIVVADPAFLIVATNPAPAGTVSVTVRDLATGDAVTVPEGFTYEGDDPEVPPTTTTTLAPDVGSGDGVGDSESPGTTTAAPPPAPPATSIDDWLDQMLITPEGLTIVPLAESDPLFGLSLTTWAGQICDEPVCPGWTIRQG